MIRAGAYLAPVREITVPCLTNIFGVEETGSHRILP